MVDICLFVFPYLWLLHCTDSNAPMLFKVHGQKMQVKAQFEAWIDGTEKKTCSSMLIIPEVIDELIMPIYEVKDHVSHCGPSYWSNLTSEFVLAAAVLDLEFWDMMPWMWPGAIDAVQAQFSKHYIGADGDRALC